jgi:hypothetical protein
MEHYVETGGEILGKGTDNLEGYEIRDKGYFGPGKLPKFQRAFFDFPHGTKEEWLFEEFKEKLQSKTKPTSDEVSDFVNELDELLAVGHTTRGDE